MCPVYEEKPFWRPQHADDTTHLLEKIITYSETTKTFICDPSNELFVRGFNNVFRYIYLKECIRGENNRNQTLMETETILQHNHRRNRNDFKTHNLSRAFNSL